MAVRVQAHISPHHARAGHVPVVKRGAIGKNLAFMYSLYESCKINELDFGRYIEDILTRMKDGDKDYLSMLPCYYKAPEIKVEECA